MIRVLSWGGLVRVMEAAFREEIDSRTRDLWDENDITFGLVKRIRAVLHGTSVIGREAMQIAAASYKAKGKTETKFGDLALVLDFKFRDGATLAGVAFFESKKRDWGTSKLASITKGQLDRIHKNLWNGKLLMYDYEPIISSTFESAQRTWTAPYVEEVLLNDGRVLSTLSEFARTSIPFTNSAVVPLGVALAGGKYDSSLYRHSLPFSYQICARNLQGLDLEHDAEVVKAAKGFSTKYGVPKQVLAVSVSQVRNEDPVPVDVNPDVLEEVVTRVQ